MAENKYSSWTKNEIWLSLGLLLISMGLASFMLIRKNWIFFFIYWLLWFIVIILGRYLVCRHCNFLGKPCPTWCFGIIGGFLYKRSNKKDFTEIRKSQFFLDVFLIAMALIFPILVYLYLFLTEGLLIFDLFLAIIYFVIGLVVFLFHSKCCTKCPIKGCPLGPKQHKK
ncbi:MAG: hypothetical protein EU539_09765 [Promethearchaeota archaeon]|nr:MAG: hypothetical protein EU539_09765 [Candidatus Lokiarchaeota archaeon]